MLAWALAAPPGLGQDHQASLLLAAEEGDADRVADLLAVETGVDVADSEGWMPIHLAADGGHEPVVSLLLDAGADPDAMAVHERSVIGPVGPSPLHLAARAGHVGVVNLLLDRGADPEAEAGGGWTPLHSAADAGRLEVVQRLITHGVELDRVGVLGIGFGGSTPLGHAAERGHEALVRLLIDAGASVNNDFGQGAVLDKGPVA